MQLDYDLKTTLEEWVGGAYRFTEGFNRLTIFTENMQLKLWKFFGKMVPLNCAVKLDQDDYDELMDAIRYNKEFHKGLCGVWGPYRCESFDVMTFYGTEDATATEEELAYEYEWKNL